MNNAKGPNARRVGYYHGQLLAARDLRDDTDNERLLRGLHVRALHDTWGVALGFDVSLSGQTILQVGPGIAYDARGGEVLSSHTLNVGVPVLPPGDADAWWFDLVIRASEPPGRPLGQLGCVEGIDPREERPVWRWCLAGPAPAGTPSPPAVSPEARLGEDIPLVRCRVTSKREFDPALDFSVRRHAQGQVRPHAAGATVNRTLVFDENQLAFTTPVSTAAGGFSRTPFYFARISIPALSEEGGTGAAGLASILGPFVSIRNAQRTSFQLDVRVGLETELFSSTLAAVGAAGPQVKVTWLGIEPTGGCPPVLNVLSLFFLNNPLPLFSTTVMLAEWPQGGSYV
ncbi:MAG TPA: hypothetical protein VIH05_00850 [Tepidiformaceae bacterium]